MARVIDFLKRLIKLVEGGKVSEAKMHEVFNGSVLDTTGGVGVYQDGNLALGKGVIPLSPDRITGIHWPEPAALPQPKAPPPVLKPKPEPKPLPIQKKEERWKPKEGGSGL